MSFLKGSTHSCLQKCEPPIYTVFVEAVGPLAVPLTGEHCTLCPLFTLTCICMSIPKVSECFEAGFCFELIVKNGLWEAYRVVSCQCKIKLLENVNICPLQGISNLAQWFTLGPRGFLSLGLALVCTSGASLTKKSSGTSIRMIPHFDEINCWAVQQDYHWFSITSSLDELHHKLGADLNICELPLGESSSP